LTALPVGDPPDGYTRGDIERLHEDDDLDDYRRRFARDHDRLVHTSAFRRLQGKTQVVTPGEADFFRTRLTHSVEVAQVARRLAQRLGADRELCEAAAILHDLGHPPFGHVGEEELNCALDRTAARWQLDPDKDLGGFNGNAQSFRLAVRSLSVRGHFRGLDLTRGVLDGALKYPYRRNEPNAPGSEKSWGFYPTEDVNAGWVRTGVPLSRRHTQSLEAQIVDWADDVAYSIHDVEDWYRAGFMPLEMLVQGPVFRREFGNSIAPKLKNNDFDGAEVAQEVEDFFTGPVFTGITRGYDGSTAVKDGIRLMRKQLFDEFTTVGASDPAALPTRHNNDLDIEPRIRLRNRILKQLLWQFVIAHPRMATHRHGQAKIVRELFEIHVDALGYDPSPAASQEEADVDIFPPDLREELASTADKPQEALRLVADHIAGMTDSYAIRLHGRLTGALPGAFNVFI
jgi:dGTPase